MKVAGEATIAVLPAPEAVFMKLEGLMEVEVEVWKGGRYTLKRRRVLRCSYDEVLEVYLWRGIYGWTKVVCHSCVCNN